MRGYVDPYNFSGVGDFGFSLKKSIKHATKGISKVATKVVGKQVVAEVSRATERTLTTGSPTTGVPIIVNPVGLAYGIAKGDPTSMLALNVGLTAAGLPPGVTDLIGTGVSAVQSIVNNAPTTPGMEAQIVDASGETATPSPKKLGRRAKYVIFGLLAVGAYYYWKKSHRR